MIEGEHLIAKHRQAIKNFGALMLFDSGRRCLQTSNMGFEGNGKALTKPHRQTVTTRPQQPATNCRKANPANRDHQLRSVRLSTRSKRVGQNAQPERE